MEREEVIRKTLYEFKQFARKGGFWERYKTLSNPLNGNRGLLGKKIRKTFVEIVNEYEPVKLIQDASCFCGWPIDECSLWRDRSIKWAEICIDNDLFFDEKKARTYVMSHISYEVGNKGLK